MGCGRVAVLPAAIFWLIVVSGVSDVILRSLLLFPAGALAGAFTWVWIGYVLHDWTARAQAPSAVVQLQPGSAPVTNNTMGPIIGNQNIVTQNQKGGTNVIINPRIKRKIDDN